MRKNFGKKFYLSRLQTIINCSVYLFIVRKFHVLNFHHTRLPMKISSSKFFPNYSKFFNA